MSLVRKMLLEIEKQESGYAPKNFVIDSYTQEQIRYHAYIMMQGGLIEGINRVDYNSTSPQAIPMNLTWAGHEFLEAARNDILWKKAMDIYSTRKRRSNYPCYLKSAFIQPNEKSFWPILIFNKTKKLYL